MWPSYSKYTLEEEDAIVLLATHYEHVNMVKDALRDYYDINVEDHEENGSLIIRDCQRLSREDAWQQE